MNELSCIIVRLLGAARAMDGAAKAPAAPNAVSLRKSLRDSRDEPDISSLPMAYLLWLQHSHCGGRLSIPIPVASSGVAAAFSPWRRPQRCLSVNERVPDPFGPQRIKDGNRGADHADDGLGGGRGKG